MSGQTATPEQKAIICLAIREWRIKKYVKEQREQAAIGNLVEPERENELVEADLASVLE